MPFQRFYESSGINLSHESLLKFFRDYGLNYESRVTSSFIIDLSAAVFRRRASRKRIRAAAAEFCTVRRRRGGFHELRTLLHLQYT